MLRRAALLAVVLALAAVGSDYAIPLDLSRAQTLSPELDDASGRVLSLRPASDGAVRLALTPAGAGPDVVRLLVGREDQRFGVMPGVDPLALVRAAGQWVRNGRIVSGGSTLAMQVARLLEPHPRTLRGKLHDILRALQLQAHLGRAGVLRLYLTLAPMGGNIEGVRAGSLLYFGREPAALTDSQAALLVGLVQSPAQRRPDRHPEAAWQAAGRVLLMAGDPAPLERTPILPLHLPALAQHLAQTAVGRVATTLDGDLQSALEALATREAPSLEPQADMAALVVRNQDGAVIAYLGGARFFGPGGMVDMVRARRSPGSALKPFIYAMAFDRGLATPDTLVDDSTLRLGAYAPRDFDRAEHGSVTAAEALRQSLNRPAVRLLARIGPSYFASALRQAGTVLHLPRGASPSAALALGGAGISLFDLASLYAGLASGGRTPTLHLRPADMGVLAGGVASPEAAKMVAAILRAQPPPPGMAADPDHQIANKTGTSYGYRDAWAAGFTPAYTALVWVGRRDGTPRPGATGLQAASPLLFRIFALLPAEAPSPGLMAAAPPNLAPALRRASATSRLRIIFPPGAVELAYAPGDQVDLRASGGAPPYRWLVDGAPAGPSWAPSGPGFTHVTVMDAHGASASQDVRVVTDPGD